MAIYSMFERQSEAPAAIGDRFSWFAALLPPLYAVVHGMWWELLAFVLALAAVIGAGMGLGDDVGFWLYVVLAAWIGFEATGLRRAAMRRKGWTYGGEIVAAGEDLATLEWLQRRTLR